MSAATNGRGGRDPAVAAAISHPSRQQRPPATADSPPAHSSFTLRRHVSDQQTLAAARALAALPQTPVPPQKLFAAASTAPAPQPQPVKIVSVMTTSASPVTNGVGSVNINSLLPTVPIPQSAINGQRQVVVAAPENATVINAHGQVLQQPQQQQQQPQRPRPCKADIVTNSMKCLRQKGSSFLRSHASKHGITNASRKLTSQVLHELTLHYMQVHGMEMHLDDPNSSLTTAATANSAPAAPTAAPTVNGHRPGVTNSSATTLQLVPAATVAAATALPTSKTVAVAAAPVAGTSAIPLPMVAAPKAGGAPQTIQIQLQPQQAPSSAVAPQLSFLTPVSTIAVLPQEPVAIVAASPASASGSPPGQPQQHIKVIPHQDPLAIVAQPVAIATAPPSSSKSSPTTLASILPKHPVPPAQLAVAAAPSHASRLSSSAPSTAASSVSAALAQLKPIAHVRPALSLAPVKVETAAPSAVGSPPGAIIIKQPVSPPRPAPPTAPAAVVILNSNGKGVATTGHNRAISPAVAERNGTDATRGSNGHHVPNGGAQGCPSGIIAKSRAELAACGTSMLRPEAAAHKVHNASRKPKETVIEELWQHYLACHGAELKGAATTAAAGAASPPNAAADPAPVPARSPKKERPAEGDGDGPHSCTPPKKRRLAAAAAAAAPAATAAAAKTTIAHVAEVAAAAAEGWVGKVEEDDDDGGNN